MQKIIFILNISVITLWVCSCTSQKAITGEITALGGRVATCEGKQFKIGKTATLPLVGDTVTFTPVKRSSKKINCKLIK